MFCTVNDSLPTPKSPKFHNLLHFYYLLLFFFFASHGENQVHCAQPLGPRHWFLNFHYLSYVWYLLPLNIDSWRVEFVTLNLSLWDQSYLSVSKFVIYSSCVVTIMLWLLNALVEVKSTVVSSFWSAALVSLVHRDLLHERCTLVDQGVPEGMHH